MIFESKIEKVASHKSLSQKDFLSNNECILMTHYLKTYDFNIFLLLLDNQYIKGYANGHCSTIFHKNSPC
jgi:hypothetical protein